MAATVCGETFNNGLTIPGIGFFPLSQDDYSVSIGTEGAKSLNVKLGSFVESVGTYRVEYDISLFHIERSIYEAIKTFAKNDILDYYLSA